MNQADDERRADIARHQRHAEQRRVERLRKFGEVEASRSRIVERENWLQVLQVPPVTSQRRIKEIRLELEVERAQLAQLERELASMPDEPDEFGGGFPSPPRRERR